MLLRIWASSLLAPGESGVFACRLPPSPHAAFPQPALDSFVWVRTPPSKNGRLLVIINNPTWVNLFFREKVSANMSAERRISTFAYIFVTLALSLPLKLLFIAFFPSVIACCLPNSLNHRVEHTGFMITLVTTGCYPIRLLGFLAQGFMRGCCLTNLLA